MITNLISFKQFTLDSFSRGSQIDIFIDFEKAFDRIDHKFILIKLKTIGFFY